MNACFLLVPHVYLSREIVLPFWPDATSRIIRYEEASAFFPPQPSVLQFLCVKHNPGLTKESMETML